MGRKHLNLTTALRILLFKNKKNFMSAFLEKMGGGSCVERVIKVANRLFKIQCIGKPIRSRPIKGVGGSKFMALKNVMGVGVVAKIKKELTIQVNRYTIIIDGTFVGMYKMC